MTTTNPQHESSAAGWTADEVLHKLDDGLPQGEIPAALFGNADVYDRELRSVFGRCWVFLGHESEIQAKGDYVLRRIGEDNFVVVRDEDGGINVLFDACRHRGVQVCRSDSGNTSHFRCPYHGWTYNTKGNLVGAPLWRNAFGGMSKEGNGLSPAAQVASYHGLIFATLDATAPSLEEYLGGMTWYLDLVFGLNSDGIEVLGPPQRFVIDANWKSGADNFSGDDYHLGTLHRSVWEIGAFPVPFRENMLGYHVQASPGHSLSFSMAPTEDEPGPKFFGYPEDLAATFDTSRISEHQLNVARRSRVFVGNVFPNFSILALPMTEDGSSHPPTGILTIRTWQPKGPGQVEVWNWFCAYKNMSPEQKERTYRAGLGTFSMGGSFEMDDTEPWITVSRTGRSVAAEVLDFSLNYQMGMPGVGIAKQVDDWPGPGIAYWTRYEEGVQRNLFSFYSRMMQAAPGQWPDLRFPE
ncbi:aromatic ring-hydroxylating dioxygenase subunit alpha [Pseudonocardia petroleophila]|uniref:Rieske 2Fe-2S domain-containing protein n=1 Tax=Pseudonocardia petroleophila TaxID=37331 RepID=A0A7G7MKJ2_9PSEU|nr:Rieske 2Fe-2S domain-containing protein [Pseudonocardia petroleophila]QNG53303.1 Rieske 2Fe-2S domain-containing protein [Pseudonocardia petroleophila]